MLSEVAFFLLGLLAVPVFCLVIFGIMFCDGKKKDENRNKLGGEKAPVFTERLLDNIAKSARVTQDVAWFNVLVQRVFQQAVDNPAFEQRMEKMIQKTVQSALSPRFVRKVRVSRVFLGKEAPYIKNIRVVGEKSTVASGDGSDSPDMTQGKEVVCEELQNEQAERLPGVKRSLYRNPLGNSLAFLNQSKAAGHSSKLKEKPIKFPETVPEAPSLKKIAGEQSIKGTDWKKTFENVVFASEIEYGGGFQLVLEIQLRGNIPVTSFIIVKSLKGTLLYRLPSVLYSTRHECSFAPDPRLEFDVVLNGGKGAVNNSISRLLRAALERTFKKTLVFPAWLSQPNWFVPSTGTLFCSEKIIDQNDDTAVEEITECVKRIMGMDYRIKSVKNNFFYRRDSEMGVVMYQVILPNNCPFGSAKLLKACERMEVLEHGGAEKQTIPPMAAGKRCDTLTIRSPGHDVAFLRIRTHDTVIFCLNPPQKGEFFAFRVTEGELQVFLHGKAGGYAPSRREMVKVIRAVTMLSEIKEDNDRSEQGKNGSVAADIVEVGKIPESELDIFCVEVGATKTKTREVISDKNLRMKLFGRSGTPLQSLSATESLIVGEHAESSMVVHHSEKSGAVLDVLVCAKDSQGVFNAYGNIKDCLSASRNLAEQIRATGECVEFALLEIKETEEKNKSVLQLRARKGKVSSIILEKFVTGLMVRLAAEKVLGFLAGEETFKKSNGYLKKELKTAGGVFFFDFRAPVDDMYRLKITSCKHRKVLFEANRIMPDTPFSIVLPSDNDFIQVLLMPKYGRNKTINYRLLNIQREFETLVRGRFLVSRNEKISLYVVGMTPYKIFWDCLASKDVGRYVEEGKKRVAIDTQGILPSGAGNYRLIFKNKGKGKQEMQLIAGLGII